MPTGVQHFYYSRNLPARSVAIARVKVPALTPAQLTDVNNTIYQQGALSVWKTATGITNPADFTAPALGIPVQIHSSQTYFVGNQFFELTNVLAADTTPLFYMHRLPVGATHIQIFDLNGVELTANSSFTNNVLYHSLDGSPARVQYINAAGSLVQEVLRYDNVISLSTIAPSSGNYTHTGAVITLADTGNYYIRFTVNNGYQVMPMYTYLSNTPWYPRIRYGLQPPPVDWGRQQFVNSPPWLQASYVAGKVLDAHMIEFERPFVFYDGAHLPDVLVFDKDNQFKYAIDGYTGTTTSSNGTPYLKGFVYPWQRGQISSMDWAKARVDLIVDLDPTDIVWAFYIYNEPDVIYTDFDCNPFTNPAAQNTILQLYVKSGGTDPNRNLYHQLLDASGAAIAGQTNDPTPGTGTNTVFAEVVVGASVSEVDFGFDDARVRGGGLAPAFQSIPQAVNFWDIGYWDGKPYPVGGALAIYLPYSILDTLSRSQIEDRINAILPMGSMAVIRYLDDSGQEWV